MIRQTLNFELDFSEIVEMIVDRLPVDKDITFRDFYIKDGEKSFRVSDTSRIMIDIEIESLGEVKYKNSIQAEFNPTWMNPDDFEVIRVIKFLRIALGIGLKDAKDFVDACRADYHLREEVCKACEEKNIYHLQRLYKDLQRLYKAS